MFEDFKFANITRSDIIKCIKNNGSIYATIIRDYPNNDPDEPIKVGSIDDDNLISVEINGVIYEVELENVTKIEL